MIGEFLQQPKFHSSPHLPPWKIPSSRLPPPSVNSLPIELQFSFNPINSFLAVVIAPIYLQKVAFSFEKSSNAQNYSSPGCHHRIKESSQENFRSLSTHTHIGGIFSPPLNTIWKTLLHFQRLICVDELQCVWGREVSNYGLDGPEDDNCLPKSAFGLHPIPASVTKAVWLKIFAAQVPVI